MIFKDPKKPLKVLPTQPLYKWSKIFNRLQRNFFEDPNLKLRREKQIEDFIYLNEFNKIKLISDTDVFRAPTRFFERVQHSNQADLVVITDQKFSRYPCSVLPARIKYYLERCPNMYLCLNRHYINIDNSFKDSTLDKNFTLAITQWLRKELPEYTVLDLSLDYVDYGQNFTWAIPDRHFYIAKK